VPLESHRKRIPGRYAEEISDSFFEPFPDEELEEWER